MFTGHGHLYRSVVLECVCSHHTHHIGRIGTTRTSCTQYLFRPHTLRSHYCDFDIFIVSIFQSCSVFGVNTLKHQISKLFSRRHLLHTYFPAFIYIFSNRFWHSTALCARYKVDFIFGWIFFLSSLIWPWFEVHTLAPFDELIIFFFLVIANCVALHTVYGVRILCRDSKITKGSDTLTREIFVCEIFVVSKERRIFFRRKILCSASIVRCVRGESGQLWKFVSTRIHFTKNR